MSYLTGTREEMIAARAALAKADGLPRRGAVYLNGVERPDLTDEIVPREFTPGATGWTEHLVSEPLEVDGQAALYLDERALAHLGKRVDGVTLPARSSVRTEDDLPTALREKVRERKEPAPEEQLGDDRKLTGR
jgi:hypothetical protein